MAYSPLPTPPPPGVPEAKSFLRQRPFVAQNKPPVPPLDASATFRTLSQAIAANTCDPDVILGAIAEAAQALTEATAAAVALSRDGAVICRGRSGQIAPELGSRLSVDSGVSGECLRTGKILRCDDTQRDYRADPEVCRRLGLRSIAVVPVRRQHQTIGIVEAFSARTYAFAEEHMDALRRLAELTEAVYEREAGLTAPVEVPPLQASPEPAPVADVIARAAEAVSAGWLARLGEDKRRYVMAGTAAVMLLLLVMLGLKFWPKPAAETTAQAAAAPSPPGAVEVSGPVAGAALVFKPSAGRVDAPGSRTSSGGVQRAAAVEKQKLESSNASAPAQTNATPDSTTEIPESVGTPPPSSAPASVDVEAPSLAAANPDATRIGNLVSAPATIPAFGSPVSEGVSQGVIIHRVQPSYPVEALPLRLEGSVVLQATIDERGRVRNLKVVSGHPLLARAAADAVTQWRYRPYLLNGIPTAMQTQIIITFKAK
jgi:TonB family protein